MERIPKGVLEENLLLMTEHVGKVFLELLNKNRGEISRTRVIKDAKSRIPRRAEAFITANDVQKTRRSDVVTMSRENDLAAAYIDSKDETFGRGSKRTKGHAQSFRNVSKFSLSFLH